jgi:hypothetical protein
MAFFLKTNAMIQFLQKLAVFWKKAPIFFTKFFGENILKIITLVSADSGNFRRRKKVLT